MYLDQKMLKYMMCKVGFDWVDYYNLIGGVVVLYWGFKY